jgi:hypothetical protein
MRRAILNLQPLSGPLARLAADANESEGVTSLDIVLLRRIILSLAEELPGEATFWRFVPSGHGFSDPTVPFGAPKARSYMGLSQSKSGQDFAAVKRGDVNASWTPSSGGSATATARAGGGAKASQSPVRLEVSGREASVGDTVRVPLKAGGGPDIAALQYTLQWDPERLSLLRTGDYGLPGMGPGHLGTDHAERGRLPVVWSDPQGRLQSLPEDGPVMALWLKVEKTGAAEVSIGSEPTPSRAYGREELSAVSIQKEGGTIRVRERPESYRFAPPAPNPASVQASLEYALPEASEVSIEVYDYLGRRVARLVGGRRQSAGRHAATLDVSGLSSGLYLVRFEARSEANAVTRTKKMVVAR